MNNDIRARFAKSIASIGSPRAMAFSAFLGRVPDDGRIPCWGEIAEVFQKEISTDEGRLEIWKVLLENGDTTPLFLFLHLNHDRPKVMRRILRNAAGLQPLVQRAVVSLADPKDLDAKLTSGLSGSARHLCSEGEEGMRREREVLESRIAALLAHRCFAPETDKGALEREP